MNNPPNYDENGVFTFEIDQFIEDLQFYKSDSTSAENEVSDHAVLNLPALSDEGIPELRQHYIQLKGPLKKGLLGEANQCRTSGSL